MKTDLNCKVEKIEYIYAITENLPDNIKKDTRDIFCKYIWNSSNIELISKEEREEIKVIRFPYFVDNELKLLQVIMNVGRIQSITKKSHLNVEIDLNATLKDAQNPNEFYLVEKRSSKTIRCHLFNESNDANYEFPVIITNYQKALIAIDGNHRISKAFHNNELDKLTFLYIPASEFMFCINHFYDAVCYCATQLVASAAGEEYELFKHKFTSNLDKLITMLASND